MAAITTVLVQIVMMLIVVSFGGQGICAMLFFRASRADIGGDDMVLVDG